MAAPDAPRWRRYLRFWGSDIARDVDAELEFHVRERIDHLVAQGVPPDVARDEVLRTLGDIERIKQTCRAIAAEQERTMRRAETFGALRQDALFALRVMRANPVVTAAIVLTLALGIGATTSIFGVVNAVLLRPLPYPEDDRIVIVWEQLDGANGTASVGHYHDWLEQTRSFSAVSAYQGRTYNLTDGAPERIGGAHATPSYFRVLDMPPALGRYFRQDETEESRVVVLSHSLWQTRFAGDPSIISKSITLNGERHSVVGVTPPGFTLSEFSPRLWTPLSFTSEERANYGAHFLVVFAKLRPGVSFDQAQRDVERVTENIRRRHPDELRNRGARVQSYTDVLVGNYRTQLWVLLAAVVLVLLIGCGNVASLLLARSTARRKEIAIRSALGSGRGRLVRQLLTESLILAGIGAAAGVFLAHFGTRFIIEMGPQAVPRLAETGLNARVLGFALLTTVICGVLFGLVPALRAARVEPQTELREGGRGSVSVVRDRLRAGLIVSEIAVALVLLVSAGLLLRSAERLRHVPLGFEPDGVTMLRLALPADRYDEAAVVEGAFTRLVERIRTIPGVQSAGAGTWVPMMRAQSIDVGITVDGRETDPDRVDLGHVRLVTDEYMETLGMTVERGRSLSSSDLRAAAPWVIVVNETFARRIFGDEDPIGQRISGWSSGPEPEWREIVGVAADARSFGLESEVPPEIYIPMTQAPGGAWTAFQHSMTIVARSGDVPITSALRAAVNEIDPTLPLFDMQMMDDVLQQSNATRRFNTLLLGALGLTGLVLAAIGIYGVIAFFVGQRTHEIGVRVALGATARDVVRLVVAQALTLTVLGVAIGGTAAYWATQALRGMLFQVDARDPITFVVASMVLVGVALVAATLPARRAAQVDPVRALASG